jgi:hypothetical protein
MYVVRTECRYVSTAEHYNDVFEVTVARGTAEIMSHGYTPTPEVMLSVNANEAF